MYVYDTRVDFKELKGKTVNKVFRLDDVAIIFICNEEEVYLMHHDQDCCEHVTIDDVNGDLYSLEGNVVTLASERTSDTPETKLDNKLYYEDSSETWTFYKLASKGGYIDIKWYGSSNGYYSESVDVMKVDLSDTEVVNDLYGEFSIIEEYPEVHEYLSELINKLK